MELYNEIKLRIFKVVAFDPEPIILSKQQIKVILLQCITKITLISAYNLVFSRN